MIGQTISHYKILEKLGEGGMGIVYKAQDTKLGRAVALKFLPPNLQTSQEELTRFQQEARALSALNHPHIATIYDVDQADEQRFIVLEYLPGGTLKSKMKEMQSSGKELSIQEVVDYGFQIADGLAYAHRRGIVHRDVKTDNMILTDEGRVKITDFGLAKLRGSAQLTRTGSTLGTAAYMSPEQVRGEEVDHRSDIFSFGIVLYELATGRLPFRGEHEAALSYSIVNEDPLPLKSLRPSVPSALADVINRCLEKEKEKRFQTMDEIVSELRKIQQGISGYVQMSSKRTKVRWVGAAVVILAAAIAGLFVLLSPKSESVERKSIAVLPFKNLSEEKENEYFSDGITEDIITQVSKISELKVISRTSVMRYKVTDKTLREIGKELDVATILEGSVRRAGNQVRIVAQLVDANTDEHLWAETYDKELTQIFAIQSDVARQIAASLKVKLSPAEKGRIEKKATESTEAYQLYLRGRFHLNRLVKEEVKKAVELFEQAVDKDPRYALAYSGLSDCYSLIAYFQYDILPLKEAKEKAKTTALKALEIDDELAEAHTSLGYFKRTFEWDWIGAEEEFKRAIELNPNYAKAHDYYALYLTALGKFEAALEEVHHALRLNPLDINVHFTHGRIYYYARQYDRAIEQLQKAMELDTVFLKISGVLGAVFEQQGMHREAIAEFQKSRTLTGVDFEGTANYEITHSKDDWKGYWRKALNFAIQRSKREPISGLVMATLYTRVGEKEKAIEWLQRAYERREGGLVYLNVEPMFDPLRSDPRFVALVRKIGVLKD